MKSYIPRSVNHVDRKYQSIIALKRYVDKLEEIVSPYLAKSGSDGYVC